MNQAFLLFCTALLMLASLGYQTGEAATPDKKSIELAWDIPSSSDLREDWQEMERTTPFDGVMFRVEAQDDQRTLFLCIGDEPELDFGGKRNPDGQSFSIFGQVIKGMDVVF